MATVVNEETGEITETDDEPVEPITVDDDDEGEANEPTPEPEPEPQGMSEADIEKANKDLEREAKRHTSAVSRVVGDDAVLLVQCPVCEPALMGLRFDVPLTDEQRAAVYALLGTTEAPEFAPLPGAELCEICNGYGECETPSHRQEQSMVGCPKCNFKGWTNEDERRAWGVRESNAAALTAAAAMPERPAVPDASLPMNDAWTRPKGHPFYGMNPVYMTAEQRAGDWPAAQ